ncbi:Uncharacterised protein [Mycolicibacterium phlei]|jgi:hypothetical protein|nr:hypothetical protein [Mycolicibacterium phlei]AMO61884.1 hypothetical protein MPHLCCUG_03079 [Mycolicibacterium phlei]KXW75185.1 hypothetical protein JL15_23845 [Mycolicibacterium phlei DSM 43071]STZ19475.1 Uncharacterised protein [Mycolicibacterium phlei]VEG09990.1 Uncharacterised protein [Mycobacteroides chelonae]
MVGVRTQVLLAAALTVGGLTGAPVAWAQEADAERCDPVGGRVIDILAGNIDCVTASHYAAQYDPAGERYQVIGPFTCYSGTAQTAPLLFQCTSPVEGGTEFAVYPA